MFVRFLQFRSKRPFLISVDMNFALNISKQQLKYLLELIHKLARLHGALKSFKYQNELV